MGLVEVVLIGAGLSTLAWLVCGVFVAVMAQRRGGRTVPWILLGVLMGPIGLYMILKVMDHHCAECRVPVLRGVRRLLALKTIRWDRCGLIAAIGSRVPVAFFAGSAGGGILFAVPIA